MERSAITDEIAEFLKAEAQRRTQLHNGHASQRPLSDDYDLVGLVGEAEFARRYGQALDLGRRTKGDSGIDFVVGLAFTIDVKCARKPFNLIVEQGKVVADIYVLAGYQEHDNSAELLGWEWGNTVKRAPVRDFGAGIETHYIVCAELRRMHTLGRRIKWRHIGSHLLPDGILGDGGPP